MTKAKIVIKPLNGKLFEEFHGKPPEYSVMGFALLDDDKVVAICCVTRFLRQTILLFDVNTEVSSFRLKRGLIEGWNEVKKLFKGEVISVIDSDKPTAEQMHKHFGFEPMSDELYVYRGA